MRVAIIREVSPAINRCEVTHVARAPIDVSRARAQHSAYEQRLSELGCRVERLPAAEAFPDSVFVEDVAVVFDEVAVVTRPGVVSRRAETEMIRPALASYRPLEAIREPGTLDGGDVLVVGKKVYVGASGRSNQAAIGQLREILEPRGYAVIGVEIAGCLHLKTAVTQVAADKLLLNPQMVDPGRFAGSKCIEVSQHEPMAANALLIGDRVIYPHAFPRTRERLLAEGITVVGVDADELAKAEGGVTCCSLIFKESPE